MLSGHLSFHMSRKTVFAHDYHCWQKNQFPIKAFKFRQFDNVSGDFWPYFYWICAQLATCELSVEILTLPPDSITAISCKRMDMLEFRRHLCVIMATLKTKETSKFNLHHSWWPLFPVRQMKFRWFDIILCICHSFIAHMQKLLYVSFVNNGSQKGQFCWKKGLILNFIFNLSWPEMLLAQKCLVYTFGDIWRRCAGIGQWVKSLMTQLSSLQHQHISMLLYYAER